MSVFKNSLLREISLCARLTPKVLQHFSMERVDNPSAFLDSRSLENLVHYTVCGHGRAVIGGGSALLLASLKN